jgi:hypothetical protein
MVTELSKISSEFTTERFYHKGYAKKYNLTFMTRGKIIYSFIPNNDHV